MPKSRLHFWGPKLEGNRQRDANKEQELKALGWHVVVIWECETRNLYNLELVIRRALVPYEVD